MALFQTHDNLEHLAMMEQVMGKMPERFARAGARSKPEFFKDGSKLDWPKTKITSRQSRKEVRSTKGLVVCICFGTSVVAWLTLLGTGTHTTDRFGQQVVLRFGQATAHVRSGAEDHSQRRVVAPILLIADTRRILNPQHGTFVLFPVSCFF